MALAGSSCFDKLPNIEVIERTAPSSKIGVFWKDKDGSAISSFPTLFELHKSLAYACNAGMYDGTPDRQPVGLYMDPKSQEFCDFNSQCPVVKRQHTVVMKCIYLRRTVGFLCNYFF